MAGRKTQLQPYLEYEPTCAVATITPADEAYMHTYYDVCPWSPSGRLLACLHLPFEDREPAPEDRAELCVIDLAEGSIRPVGETAGWGFQTAAHQQWGRSDRFLYFNDKRDGRAFGVRLDLETGQRVDFDGPIWQVHPDETFAICTCLNRGRLTQRGYGVTVRPEQELTNTVRADDDDGLFRVDLTTGKQSLLIGLDEVWQALPDRQDLEEAILYAFHCKFNPQARFEDGRFVASLLTAGADGSGLRTIVPHRLWRRGGHHPIWHPDGEKVLMNLTPGDEGMRFCLIDADSGQVEVLIDDPPGSGHPSISTDGRWLLTDATRESGGIRTAPIRLVDLQEGTWRDLCAAESPAVGGSPLRRDAHPVWDRHCRLVCFLAAPNGRRQLFVADPDLPPSELPKLFGV